MENTTLRKFKHVETGKIFINIHPGVYTENGDLQGTGVERILPAWVVEHSKEWKEIIDLCVSIPCKFTIKDSPTVYTIEGSEDNQAIISYQIGRGRTSTNIANDIVNSNYLAGVYKEYKPSLFTTHDGVEIYEGDFWWYVVDNAHQKPARRTNTLEYKGTNTSTITKFSTKEAADAYILAETKARVMFTNSEGAPVHIGDMIYAVNTTNYKKVIASVCAKYTSFGDKFKTFSDSQTATEFLLRNKPCLSINEIAEVYTTATQYNSYKGTFSSQGEKLRSIVRTKLE